jgi:hypothetical protein
MNNPKVKVVKVVGKNEIEVSYREMTPEEIKVGEFIRKFLGTKEPEQSSAIVKYTREKL